MCPESRSKGTSPEIDSEAASAKGSLQQPTARENRPVTGRRSGYFATNEVWFRFVNEKSFTLFRFQVAL